MTSLARGDSPDRGRREIRSTRLLFAAAALLVLAEQPASAGEGDCRRVPIYPGSCSLDVHPPRGCEPIPYARLPCFTVRGRLFAANGAPAIRLRPSGTSRLLGVLGGDGDAASPTLLPSQLRSAMTPSSPGFLRPLTGDFRVCPLAPEQAGRMRPVCIVSAAHLVAAPGD